jgi:hypothetical protein
MTLDMVDYLFESKPTVELEMQIFRPRLPFELEQTVLFRCFFPLFASQLHTLADQLRIVTLHDLVFPLVLLSVFDRVQVCELLASLKVKVDLALFLLLY